MNSTEFKIINVFDAERLNSRPTDEFRDKMNKVRNGNYPYTKNVHVFNLNGEYLDSYISSRDTCNEINVHNVTVAAMARGKYCGGHKFRGFIIINNEVLSKLDELLEPHQDLRVISSEAREACIGNVNVQRLIGEQSSNKPNTSVQQSKFSLDFD